MALGNIGRMIAGEAVEAAKKNVMDSLRGPEASKAAAQMQSAPPAPVQPGENIGAIILGQLQAMQRNLHEDQELVLLHNTGVEMLRVVEIFVPTAHLFVLAGIDEHQNVTRVIAPSATLQLVCKIMPTPAGSKPVRVNVLTPRPKNEQPG